MKEKATTCPYCGVGCGVLAQVSDQGVDGVRGDTAHPANRGRLCVKGSSLHETLGSGGRLAQPQLHGRAVSWEEAIEAVAKGLRETSAAHGPESLGFYLSGQLLTEDYYVANKLAKGFLGTPHVDTNSRLCMSSAVAGYKRALGADAVPGCYEDLDMADLLVITGANPAWNHPILYQRMKRAQEADPSRKVVVIDPRRTASCELADLHLPIAPGSDAVLWNGLLVALAAQDALDQVYIDQHCTGFAQALAAARASAPDICSVARQCDVPESDVRLFYDWFMQTPRTLSFFSQGINQSSSGTDKCNAIINCHLATGRIGKPGASPFSITGQPNAMGGREVGGLANQLAAHRDYTTPGAVEEVAAFWGAPHLVRQPGYTAVELFEAAYQGKIKALWIMATNPVVSLPDASRAKEALRRCPLVIVSDCVQDSDTLALADIVLPAQGWSEKDGTVTNSERRISRQRALLPPLDEARPDWWIMSRVAEALGFADAFAYQRPAEVFREHAALSALNNTGQRMFNIGGLADLSDAEYEQLEPVQWPVPPGTRTGRKRLFSEGDYVTPDGRGHFIPIEPQAPRQQRTAKWPLRLNTGRIRDQWHTMTRTGRAARLLQHQPEPFIDIHPQDMVEFSLREGDLAWVYNQRGRFLGRVHAAAGQRRGEIFLPIHWNAQFTGSGVVSRLVAPVVDPLSGQPESKHGVVTLVPFAAHWHARLLTRHSPQWPRQPDYWARVPLANSRSWYLAGENALDWTEAGQEWMGRVPDLALVDAEAGRYRAAWLEGTALAGVLLVEPANHFPELGWLDSLFAQDSLSPSDRRQVLAGQAAGLADTGAIICSCFQVGEKVIEQAVAEGCDSIMALGERLQCGTNCGSCIPELKGIIEGAALPENGAVS